MKVTVYPNIAGLDGKSNPYIKDFIHALESEGCIVMNKPHKNPLVSLFFKKRNSDVYILHWIENVPDYKYGFIQAIIAVLYVFSIKMCGKKIVWFLHNKKPHTNSHFRLKRALMKMMITNANVIITHASEGKQYLTQEYPSSADKTFILDHPTKNRMQQRLTRNTHEPDFDILIWGKITLYKQIPEFLEFLKEQHIPMKVKVVGTCSSDTLYNRLWEQKTDFVDIENRNIPFEELSSYIQNSSFVLIPYASDSVLSSAILMDSLSFGAKVIGPNVGSFRDYAASTLLKVYTFDDFTQIPDIIANHADDNIVEEDYIRFLNENNWAHFAKKLVQLLTIKNTR